MPIIQRGNNHLACIVSEDDHLFYSDRLAEDSRGTPYKLPSILHLPSGGETLGRNKEQCQKSMA